MISGRPAAQGPPSGRPCSTSDLSARPGPVTNKRGVHHDIFCCIFCIKGFFIVVIIIVFIPRPGLNNLQGEEEETPVNMIGKPKLL
jgi:hypothetical protein